MYPHLRDEARWVVPEVLAYQAAARGEAPFVTMVDGPALTYAQAQDEAARVAGFLAALGVQPGDMVAVMLPNGLDFVRMWLGLARLGAVLVALNTDLKGAFLEHQLENAGARLAIVDRPLLDRFAELAPRLGALKTVVTAGTGEALADFPFSLTALEGWRTAEPYGGPMPRAGDTHCVMYTSGTTGPSKGVLMPHGHAFLFGIGSIDNYAMTESDRFYICLPLFHANGLFMQLFATMIAGCDAVLRERFSASAWISDIRRYGATVTNSLGAVTAFVVAQPPRPDDRDHHLRLVGAAPNPAATEAVLRERFGIADVIGLYGMTEVNIPLYCEMGNPRPGTCGRLYERYFEVEIRDPQTDIPVPRGSVGEVMVRPKAAFGFMTGYHRMPDKTVEAWRNLWFHTGDAAVMGEDGYVTFVDRIKDCIRRRGENVSSYEVETAIARLDGVEEVAAYGVPTGVEGAEDEIMLAVVPSPGAPLDPQAIARHAARELPRYAQPRYIEIVDALPKTPTAKIQKAKLRGRGVGPGVWDREKDGV
ncbi:MAG TPA: AMP-binding protein [Azospirillum sp.]|nr:AMP-binding protein [Azospirillum sp.]